MLITGLILNIVGTVLLAVFGIPKPTFNTEGHIRLIASQTDPEEAAAARGKKLQYEMLSRMALAFLLAGFVFQLAAAVRRG